MKKLWKSLPTGWQLSRDLKSASRHVAVWSGASWPVRITALGCLCNNVVVILAEVEMRDGVGKDSVGITAVMTKHKYMAVNNECPKLNQWALFLLMACFILCDYHHQVHSCAETFKLSSFWKIKYSEWKRPINSLPPYPWQCTAEVQWILSNYLQL